MKEKSKSKFAMPADLVERVHQIRAELQAKGSANLALGDVFEAIVRQALNNGSPVSINKVWTFERAYVSLKKLQEDAISSDSLTKEKLRTLWRFFEDRAKETELAIGESGTSGIKPSAPVARKRGSRKANQSTEEPSLTGESTGESGNLGTVPLLAK